MAGQKAWLYSLAGTVASPVISLLYRVKFRNKNNIPNNPPKIRKMHSALILSINFILYINLIVKWYNVKYGK